MSLYDRTEVVRMEEPGRTEGEGKGGSSGATGIFATMKKNLLPVLTVMAVVGGVSMGFILRTTSSSKWTPREVMYIQFPGDLFLRMLKGLIIPLLVASVTAAIGSLDFSLSKKIGGRAVLYYVSTTLLAVIEGIILVLLIKPGSRVSDVLKEDRKGSVMSRPVTTADTLLDLVRNLFPPNLVQSCIAQYRTVIIPPKEINETNSDIKLWDFTGEYTGSSNVLGLVVFSVVQGIAIAQMGKVGKPLQDFYTALGEAMMLITNWVIWLSPIGVFFLVAAKVLEAESFAVMVGQMGMYFLTVMVGLILHGFIVVPLIYVVCVKKMPIKFIANMGQAIITAFATGSSSATLSVSMGCLEEKNGIDTRVSRFVMPIGATINMDGTALYEAVAVIFISQVRHLSLSLTQIISVSITATMASIGAASIPQAGLVTMVMVLDTVGLPAEDVSLIFAVDWLLDRFRTTVNVLGDAIGAGVVAHLSQKELAQLPTIN
uniref:Amino acid transporter n=1 Tax=Lygus hesperus TaxID=30085 RepID=A0A0K8SXQ7_LYGHE